MSEVIKRRLRGGVAAILLAGAAVQAAAAPSAAASVKTEAAAKTTTLAPDPAVRFGTLANGLHYAVMQNDMPAGAISVRLALRVGSYDEADDERGYAHFIEHMAFRSTRLAPQGVLDNRFAPLGVTLGKDQNAFTGLLSTLYAVDIPTGSLDGLQQILAWLRSGASDIVLTPAAVEAERGVVIAEIQSRNGPIAAAQREVMRFQAPGLRSADREPGGTEESLRAISPTKLQAFYDRWYRPENATLVIVGNAAPDALQRLVEQNFADWKGRGQGGARIAPPERLPERGTDVLTAANAAMPAAVSSCRLVPRGESRDPAERLRKESLSRLWAGILTERLSHASSAAGSPLLGALAMVNRDLPDARASCLLAIPVAGKWKEALTVGQAELRRFAKDGPTEAEVTKEIADLQGPLYGAVSLRQGRKSPELATALAAAALDDRVFQSPEAAAATSEALLDGVEPGEVRKAFAEDWSGTGPLIAVIGPEAPDKEAVLAAWHENESAAPLAAYTDREAVAWPYDFGKPGKVARRERIASPEFTRIHFRNGVVLNFRHSELEPGDVDIRIRFGSGARGLAPAERGPAQFGASLFVAGGLDKMDLEQIGTVYAQTSWKFEMAVRPTAFLLTSSPLADQTAGELRLLAAYMSDPGFRTTIDEKLPTAIDFAYRFMRTEPAAIANDALEQTLFPGQSTLPAREVMDRWRSKDFERLLRPAIAASPIEVTVVGDISEKEAVAATAASFGALPARSAPANQPGFPFRRFPDHLPGPITTYHHGPADKAAAMLIWPLYVATPERRKEEYALSILASIFKSRLIQRIRVEMGKVYSPAVGTEMPDHADQGFLAAGVEAAPGDIEAILAATKRIARDLADGPISQDELDKARQPIVASMLQMQRRNSAWAALVSEIAHAPAVADELLGAPRLMSEISLADVRAAAAWLKQDAFVSTALPAPPAAAQGQRAGSAVAAGAAATPRR